MGPLHVTHFPETRLLREERHENTRLMVQNVSQLQCFSVDASIALFNGIEKGKNYCK